MTAYALVELEIADMNGMAPYISAVGPTITGHGGRTLAQSRPTQVVEGGPGMYPIKVVIEFPSIEAAKGWYGSPEYQAILPHRLASAKSNFLWVEGV